ncbi:MAG: hypothetical protein J3Q66DRAFT_324208 [Benniella sp.]|nr:MAG: hypothetical protein J3Q66DRAFT_324208 [Benniella sp.]
MGTSQRNHSQRAQSRLTSKDYKIDHDASYVPQSDASQVFDRMLCAEPESILYLSPSVADVPRCEAFSSPEMAMDVDAPPSTVIDHYWLLNSSLNSDFDQFNDLQKLMSMTVQYPSQYQQPATLQPSYYESSFMTAPSFPPLEVPFQSEPYSMGEIQPTTSYPAMAGMTAMTSTPVPTLYPTSVPNTEPILQSRNGRGKKASYSLALPTNVPVYIYPSIPSASSSSMSSPVSPTPSCQVNSVRPRQQARGSKRSRPHTPETRDIFKCDRCPKEFDRRYNYTQHYRTHSPNKDFKCVYDGCNAAFHRKADLQRHQLRHTGELPIKCKFDCGANFRRVEAMTRHCKQVHPQDYSAYKHQKEQQRASKNANARERR